MNAKAAAAAAAAASSLILLREDIAGIAVLTLNRPQARNSLSEAMLEALGDALTAIAHERTVRAVVIAANGPAFSAGHDLKELNPRRTDDDRGRAYFKHIMGLCSAMMQQIVTLPQPVIAAVQATATAAGCQLVASCDLAVASRAAKFATPGVNIGLFCSTPMVALSRNVSRKHAMEMLLTGEMISAERRRAHRSRQPRRRARQRARGGAQAREKNRRQIGADDQDRQGSVLSPARNAARRGLQIRLRGDGREHAGARRRGRHQRLHREARAEMARPLTFWTGARDEPRIPIPTATSAAFSIP